MGALAGGLKPALAFVASRPGITVFKGALAYTLVIGLPMLFGYDRLSAVPTSYSAAVIVAIASFPGKSMGECLFGIITAMLGVSLGAVNFVILSKLRGSLVAQAIVFVIMVYILALIKVSDPRLFGFALLAILMTFNGVYTSIFTGAFRATYLKSYIKGYAWGAAVSAGVNLFVFPISSEKELRQTLVLSLDHIGTFSHLLAKTYTMTLTDGDRELRDQLSQTIRQDFGLLNQKVGATTIEINFSRWSIQDYHVLISQTRTMQLSLIALHSSLVAYEKTPVPLFEERFLPSTIQRFHQLRRDTHRTIVEIQMELGCTSGSKVSGSSNANKVYFDLEKQAPASMPGGPPAIDDDNANADSNDRSSGETKPEGGASNGAARPGPHRGLTEQDIRQINQRLIQEAESAAPLSLDSDGDLLAETAARELLGRRTTGTTRVGPADDASAEEREVEIGRMRGCVKRMKHHFNEWEVSQRDLLTDAIVSGKLTGDDMTLHVKQPRPSVYDSFGPDLVRGRQEAAEREDELRHRAGSTGKKETTDRDYDTSELVETPLQPTSATDVSSNHSLMRVFSVMFVLEQFTTVLAQCHAHVKQTDAQGRPRRRRLRFHLFESLTRKRHHHSDPLLTGSTTNAAETQTSADAVDPPYPADAPRERDDNTTPREYPMKEALAVLEGRGYVPTKPTIWQRLDNLEAMTRSPNSIYAMKVAGASLVFGSLIWASGSRAFFIKYNITGSLLTIVVALTPTLGQSLRSFVFQIAGSGMGYIVGLIILEIFKDVGGYHFNPYGIVCLVALYSLPMSYILYLKPPLFTFVLLAMNACGVLIVSEYVSVVYLHNIKYGDPPIRVARSLAGLAIALAITIAFQLLVLRNPARRTLRQKLAEIVYANLSYNNILQALVRGTMSADPTFRPPLAAVREIVSELAHREIKIQELILSTLPLVAFAQDEPQLSKKFEAGAITQIIRASQLILDRQAEARTAIGYAPFSAEMTQHFISVLGPYRKRIMKIFKARFCLAAASLSSKTPLPHDTQFENWLGNITHDALVQSQLFAKTPEGINSIQTGEFTRYWFYLLTISSLGEQLGIIEDACRILFGEIEDDPRLS